MGDGWFMKIRISDKSELAKLMDEAASITDEAKRARLYAEVVRKRVPSARKALGHGSLGR